MDISLILQYNKLLKNPNNISLIKDIYSFLMLFLVIELFNFSNKYNFFIKSAKGNI